MKEPKEVEGERDGRVWVGGVGDVCDPDLLLITFHRRPRPPRSTAPRLSATFRALRAA